MVPLRIPDCIGVRNGARCSGSHGDLWEVSRNSGAVTGDNLLPFVRWFAWKNSRDPDEPRELD